MKVKMRTYITVSNIELLALNYNIQNDGSVGGGQAIISKSSLYHAICKAIKSYYNKKVYLMLETKIKTTIM